MRMRLFGPLIFCATLLNGAITDGGAAPGTAFHRYSTEDRFGRTVTFYVSASSAERPLPLAAFVQGTGCASHFERQGERIVQGARSWQPKAARQYSAESMERIIRSRGAAKARGTG
jgi:hypothetical protein